MPGPGKLDVLGFRNLKIWQGAEVTASSVASYLNRGANRSLSKCTSKQRMVPYTDLHSTMSVALLVPSKLHADFFLAK